jgi:antitoxin (DNA-binding transcriptional repressor) of toxin-antitoxin stability system
MKTVSMLDLRSRGRDIVRRLERGERLGLTYRGRKVATLVPVAEEPGEPFPTDDSIFQFVGGAEPMGNLTNEHIDQVLYGDQAGVR